jgi:hypothetical protein
VDLLAVGRVGEVAGGAVVHDDDVADGLELLEQGPGQGGEGLVDEQDLVLGVVGHVDQLFGEQPDVQRVQHPVGAGGGEVELEVAAGVPAERRDPAVAADAQGVENPAQPPRPIGPFAVGRRLLATGRDGDDHLVGEQPLGPRVEVRQRERKILHEPVHRASPVVTDGAGPD